MVLCFDLSREAKNALDALMASGQFQNVSEAASTAFVSYEVISRAGVLGEPVVITPRSDRQMKQPSAVEPTEAFRGVPALLKRRQLKSENLKAASVADADYQDAPPNRWIFGQYNKLLPLKVSCRALLNIAQEYPAGIPLVEAANRIAADVAVFGDYLQALDSNSRRAREDAFSAAMPSTATLDTGSRARFANQFVGDLRQPSRSMADPEVKFTGLPSAFKFATCTREKTALVELTQPGRDFAVMENPLLDVESPCPIAKFSDAEVAFLLEHVKRTVPEEASAYWAILDGVVSGANTPSALDDYLCNRFAIKVTAAPEAANEITGTFLTTQRTGAISRMADMRLLGRKKSGLYVNYFLTDSGKAFLDTK